MLTWQLQFGKAIGETISMSILGLLMAYVARYVQLSFGSVKLPRDSGSDSYVRNWKCFSALNTNARRDDFLLYMESG